MCNICTYGDIAQYCSAFRLILNREDSFCLPTADAQISASAVGTCQNAGSLIITSPISNPSQ
jgi:hypothetical protein